MHEAPLRDAYRLKRPPRTHRGVAGLGRLEVSSIGLGVQNMSRTYQTTVRPGRR